MGEQDEGADMAPTFPPSKGNSLGIPPANAKSCEAVPTDQPFPDQRETRPHGFLLLASLVDSVEGLMEMIQAFVDEDREKHARVELEAIAINAQILHVYRTITRPTLSADPLVDLQDLQALYNTLQNVVPADDASAVHRAGALQFLTDLLASGGQS